MTVRELIKKLESLSPVQKDMPVVCWYDFDDEIVFDALKCVKESEAFVSDKGNRMFTEPDEFYTTKKRVIELVF